MISYSDSSGITLFILFLLAQTTTSGSAQYHQGSFTITSSNLVSLQTTEGTQASV